MITALLTLALLGQARDPKTTAAPGKASPYAVTIQGIAGATPIPISGNISTSGAGDTVGTTASLAASGNTCSVSLAGQGGAGMFLASGTLAATLTPEYSTDNGTTWTATSFIDKDGTKTSTQVFTNPSGATQLGIVVLGGARQVRVRVSSFTSGAASCTLVATTATSQGAAGGGGGSVTQGSPPWTQRLQDGAGSTLATVTAGNALKVDGSAVTQPVSASSLPLPTGASTSAKQPALGTAGSAATDVLTVQGIASMTALKVDGSAVTQPVSASSLPLPTGAATAAKQPALGTAGTASADVITVQGAASMTPLLVDASATTQPVSGTVTAVGAAADGATVSGNPVRVGAVGRANGAAPTAVTAGQASNLTTDLEHRLWVQTNHPNTFSCSNDGVSAVTQCQAAPGASLSLYITDLAVSASAAINVKIVYGTGTNCATGQTVLIPAMWFNANAGATRTFASPVKVASNNAVCCLPSGASGSCSLQGYTAP
jgi:hypothetical protein